MEQKHICADYSSIWDAAFIAETGAYMIEMFVLTFISVIVLSQRFRIVMRKFGV